MLVTMFRFQFGVLLFVTVYCADLVEGLEEGDSCSLDEGSLGVCKLLIRCQSALNLLQSGIYPTNICRFLENQPIVCCKVENTTTTTTTTKVTTITTTTEKSDYGAVDRTPGEISKKKCIEYGKYVYELSRETTFFIRPQIINTTRCGIDYSKLIVGTSLANEMEFPHMAFIGYNIRGNLDFACGGSIISENFVLTAANCLRNPHLDSPILVRVGMTNLSDPINMQERRVTEIIVHPDYQYPIKYHDIGLLRFSENFNLNIYVRPACLYTQKEISKKKAIASGWGKISFVGKESNDLLKLILEFFSVDKCNQSYRRRNNAVNPQLKDGIVDDWMVCAGATIETRDVCQGNGGGPLQIYHNESEVKCMYDIVGIISFGKPCGLAKNIPSVYTRVSNYIKWIEDIVWPY